NSDYAVDLQQNLTRLSATWNSNTYVQGATRNVFRVNSRRCDFAEWKNATGYDEVSSCVEERLTGTKVFLRANRFEPGRANIVVYNWDKLSEVAVNVGSVGSVGTAVEVGDAQ